MATTSNNACATCGEVESLKKCGRCKQVSYCSTKCQKADWAKHRELCSFAVTSHQDEEPEEDALVMLRSMPSPPTKPTDTKIKGVATVMKVFNTAELRLAIFSLLPAQELLVVQRVSRSWYIHVALEESLQQRLFFHPRPGQSLPTDKDWVKSNWAIVPRDDKQRKFAVDILRREGTGSAHFIKGADDKLIEKRAEELREDGVGIILNPFFTKLWPQLPENMAQTAYTARNKKACYFHKEASWRRVQLTSPSMVRLAMSVWITRPSDGRGNQLRPEIRDVSTGVTLGHFADLLDTIPKKFTRHWMSIDGSAWWLQSADTVVVPGSSEPGGDASESGRVYVNPSNGLAFPGGF